MTDVQICNVALAQLGLQRISSLTSDSREAVSCNLHYQQTVNELLAEETWRWAVKRQSLAASGDTNLTAYDNLFQLPSDIVRLVKLYDSDDAVVTEYEIEGDKVATDSDSLKALYVWEVDDPQRFPPVFSRAVSMMLAYKLAIEYKQARVLQNDALNMALMALERARQIDAVSSFTAAEMARWEDIF